MMGTAWIRVLGVSGTGKAGPVPLSRGPANAPIEILLKETVAIALWFLGLAKWAGETVQGGFDLVVVVCVELLSKRLSEQVCLLGILKKTGSLLQGLRASICLGFCICIHFGVLVLLLSTSGRTFACICIDT